MEGQILLADEALLSVNHVELANSSDSDHNSC